MKRLLHADNFRLSLSSLCLTIFSGDFQRCLIGFCSAVTEKNTIHSRRRAQPVRQLDHRRIPVQIGDVNQFFCLILDRLHNLGRGMPQTIDRDTRYKIQIFFAMDIGQPWTMPLANSDQTDCMYSSRDFRSFSLPFRLADFRSPQSSRRRSVPASRISPLLSIRLS